MNAALRTVAALPAHRGSRRRDETAITHSIWTVGSCVAVGYDKDNGTGGVGFQGLVETLSDAMWKPTAVPDVSSKVTMPGGSPGPGQARTTVLWTWLPGHRG